MNDALPPPRRVPRLPASGQLKSSKPATPARGFQSYEFLYSGIAPWIGGPSTSLASMVFHFAPNIAEPSGVMMLTTCETGSTGAISGRGAGGAGGVAGACAIAMTGMSNADASSAARASGCTRSSVRMFCPPRRRSFVDNGSS